MEKRVATPQNFVIRPYENSDEPGVLSLWEAAFGQTMVPEVWAWKFHKNPFGREMSVCVTEYGRPVALYSGIPYPFMHVGEEIRLVHLMDNMSHPDFRFPAAGKRGLFGLTVSHYLASIGNTGTTMAGYGFPGYRHFRLGNLQYNYLKLTSGMAFLQCSKADIQVKKSSILRNSGLISRSDQTFSRLQHDLRRFYPLAAKRDEQFIHWRYFSHPVYKYKVISIKSIFGNLKSWAVLRFDGETATLVDLFCPDDDYEMNALLAGVSEELTALRCNLIRTWLPANHFTVRKLKSAGFSELPEPLGIIPAVTVYNPALSFGFLNENLFYTMGDGDLF